MKKILLTKEDNSKQEVDVIRYFKYKNDYFLIYTLHEYDEKNYIKLYLVKVLKELDEYIGYDITDKDEWKKMQGVVKKVIKEIKSNKKKDVQDLDCDTISNIRILEPRFFKLDKKLVEILKSNYSFDSVDSETSTTIVPEITDINKKEISSEQEDIDSNYKEMYDSLKEEKDASDLLIEDLVNNLIEYKEKYGDIKSE